VNLRVERWRFSLTDDQREKVVAALALGAWLNEAASAARVPLREVRSELSRGRSDREAGKDSPEAEFQADCLSARSRYVMELRADALTAARANRRAASDFVRMLSEDPEDDLTVEQEKDPRLLLPLGWDTDLAIKEARANVRVAGRALLHALTANDRPRELPEKDAP
jgi:hypothetical protein